MKVHLVAALCLAIGAHSAFAADGGGDAKKQEMFAKAKEIKLAGTRGRVEIGQQAASCIEAAQNHDALKACDEKERQALKDLQHRQKESWQSLKPH